MEVMVLEKLLSRHSLANGLSLELWDRSQVTAGDRLQVVLEARVAIPISAATLPPDLRPQLAAVIAALGRELVFSQQKVRNFIAASQVAGLLEEMKTRFLSAVSDYLGHPDFAPRFIRKQYHAYLER